MSAVETKDGVHGFDAIVAEALVRNHKGAAFDPGETESCGKACGTGAEDESIIDFAGHGDLCGYPFVCVDSSGVVVGCSQFTIE